MIKILFNLFIIIILPITNILAIEFAEKPENNDYNVKVAVVDVQLILERSIAIQRLKKNIEEISQIIQENVSKKEVELKTIEEALVKKKGTIEDRQFENEVNEFNKKVSEVQQDIQSKKIRLEKAHNNAFGKVYEIIISIIKDLAEKYQFNLALPSSQVVYASSKLNITDEVLMLLNKKIKAVEVKF